MNEHGGKQQFLPEQVDEQIEYLEHSTQQQPASQFIQDLRIASQDHDELFDRVWNRLLEYMEETQIPATAVQPQQEKRRSSMSQLQSVQRPKLRQRIMSWTTLVAALILAVLVTGSSIVVFQYAARSQQPHNSNLVASVKATATKKPVATPPPLPAAVCNVRMDAGWEAVCKANQQTTINQVRQLNGYSVHMYAAYADFNRIILVYSMPSSVMNTKQPQLPILNLSAQAGVHLSPESSGNGYNETATKQIYQSESIPLLSVADNISTLHMHADIGFFRSNGKVSFDFSLPFHRDGHIVNINQTQIVNGQPITLDHVSISSTQTIIYIRSSQLSTGQLYIESPDGVGPSGYDVSVDSWKSRSKAIEGGSWNKDDDKHTLPLGAQLKLNYPLLNKTGEWTLLIRHEMIPGATNDVVFHFKV